MIIDPIVFENECIFKTSRSGGKGGQHVNKTETKVALWFHVATSTIFSDAEKERICKRLSTYINDDGYLQFICDEQRSQLQNKQLVIERATRMLDKALKVTKPRKRTTPTKASIEKRLNDKRQNALKKTERGKLSE